MSEPQPDTQAPHDSTTPRGELLAHVLVLAVVATLCWPILSHPSETIYSGYSDIFPQHYPNRHLLAASLRERGTLPTWNPTTFGGMPMAGDPQAGLHYPPNWLHALTPADQTSAWFGWQIVLHLLALGWGMLFWLRPRGLPIAGRVAGAVGAMLVVKWLYHVLVPGHVVFLALAWLPWQLGSVERLWLDPSPRRTALFVVATSLLIAGLHPQLLFYSELLAVGYALVFGACCRPARPLASLAWLAVGSVVTLLVTAPHLLPTIDLLSLAVRGSGLPYEKAAAYGIEPGDLVGLLIQPTGDRDWERSIYLGSTTLVLALFALARLQSAPVSPAPRPAPVGPVIYLTLGLGLSVWYALGDTAGLHEFCHYHVPGFGLFRIPSRLLLVAGVPLGYLAACGLAALTVPRRPGIAVTLLATLALVGAGVLTWWCVGSTEIPASRWVWGVAALSLPAVLTLGRFLLPARATHLAWLGLALVAADGLTFLAPKVETRPLDEILTPNPLVERLAAPLGTQRFLALNYAMPGSYTALPLAYSSPARLESLRGFNPLLPRATYRYVHTGIAQDPQDWAFRTVIREFPIRSRPHLDFLNVRWVLVDEPLDVPGLEVRDEIDDLRLYHFPGKVDGHQVLPKTYVYENVHALPRAYLVRRARVVADETEAIRTLGEIDPRAETIVASPADLHDFPGDFQPVPLEHDGDEIRLTVDAGDGAYLVLSELWYPGWKATLDGESVPLKQAAGMFQMLILPPGEHEVLVRYRPTAWVVGSALGVVGLVCLAVLLLMPTWWRPRADSVGG